MKLNYRTFPGVANPLASDNMKRQLYWVLIVALSLLVAVRAGSFVGSLLWRSPAEASVASTSETSAPPADASETVAATSVATTASDTGSAATEQPTATQAIDQPAVLTSEPVAAVAVAEETLVTQPAAPAEQVVTTTDIDEQARDAVDDLPAADNEIVATNDEQSNDVAARVLAALGAGSAINARENDVGSAAWTSPDALDAPADAQTPADETLIVDAISGWPAADLINALALSAQLADPGDQPPAPRARAKPVLRYLFGADAQTAEPAIGDAASQETVDSVVETETTAATSTNPAAAASELQGAVVQSAPAADDELVLVNPSNSGGTINYLVNGHTFSMAPGQSQRLPAQREWRIQFHRGGRYGDANQVLRTGRFEFRAGNQGWQLSAAEAEAQQ